MGERLEKGDRERMKKLEKQSYTNLSKGKGWCRLSQVGVRMTGLPRACELPPQELSPQGSHFSHWPPMSPPSQLGLGQAAPCHGSVA